MNTSAGKRPRLGLLMWIFGICYILDQATKLYIVNNFPLPMLKRLPGGTFTISSDVVPIIKGYFNIVRVHNTGVAFGIGNGTAWSTYVFLIVPILAIGALILGYVKGFFNTVLLRIAWALLLAGVFGNLTDRLIQGFILDAQHLGGIRPFWKCLTGGYVVDFIDITIPLIEYRWPSFNIADSCICIAACLFAISAFLPSPSQKPQQKAEDISKNPLTD